MANFYLYMYLNAFIVLLLKSRTHTSDCIFIPFMRKQILCPCYYIFKQMELYISFSELIDKKNHPPLNTCTIYRIISFRLYDFLKWLNFFVSHVFGCKFVSFHYCIIIPWLNSRLLYHLAKFHVSILFIFTEQKFF